MNNEPSFQYPKYTRKLFVQNDDSNEAESDNNNVNNVNNTSQSPNNTPSLNQNSIANQLYQQTPQPIASHQYYPQQQNMQYSPPNNMNYMATQNNVPNQMYMPMYQQPMSYPQHGYQQYQMQPPNYVEMIKSMQQMTQNQYMNQQVPVNNASFNQHIHDVNKNNHHDDISAKLTKRGASLDDYEDGDDSNVMPYKNNKKDNVEHNKNRKGKKRDMPSKNRPVISYEDTYFTPKAKNNANKVTKPTTSSVKTNSFADKYKKLIGKKENVEPEPKSSDSDGAPEEVKIEKKVTILPIAEKTDDLPVVAKIDPVEETPVKESSDSDSDLEDEEQKTQFIQGTGISLESEEDIKKWQEQRKINWMLKVSNKKNLHNEILKNPENFKDSEDAEIQNFLKFQKDHNITADTQEIQKNTFKEFGKIKETVRKMFQQIDKDNNNSSVTNIASMKLIKMEEEKDNLKILPFIKALGDMNKLEYTLTDNEKEKLFGPKR